MAITASFLPGARVLSVFGDAASNRITLVAMWPETS